MTDKIPTELPPQRHVRIIWKVLTFTGLFIPTPLLAFLIAMIGIV